MPTFSAILKLHRATVKFMIVLGLLMLLTGTVLRNDFGWSTHVLPQDLIDQIRSLHRLGSAFFSPVLLIMLATGSYMYFYPYLLRSKIIRRSMEGHHFLKFNSAVTVAKETKEFRFDKPAGFTYLAGQHLDWNEINPAETDDEGPSRAFSLSSAPFENYLALTTRLRDTAFKRVLQKMKPGDQIEATGPEGHFLLSAGQEPVVFLAGGIGITPFRSLALQAAHDQNPRKIFLFYSNHNPEDAAYLDELQELSKTNKDFKLIATMTQDPKWPGEKGYITKVMLKKYLSARELSTALFYLAGPPVMVAALRQTLAEVKIPPERILTEQFTGY